MSLQSEDLGSGQTHDAEPAVTVTQRSSKEQQAGRLAELAAAAQLSQRHVLHGIAAGRPQRLVSPSCWVPVALAEGAAMRSHVQQLIPFEDLQEVDEEEVSELLPEHIKQQTSSRVCLPASSEVALKFSFLDTGQLLPVYIGTMLTSTNSY